MKVVNPPICVTNLEDGEEIHQRCLLITGQCTLTSPDGNHVRISTKVAGNVEAFPEQMWPTAGGHFRALVMLTPGLNTLHLAYVGNDYLEYATQIRVYYIPLVHCPPLHLAIMVGSDSPCVIDCPPHKAGGSLSAQSNLNAAIAKLRMTAYMWQAMVAEDMRSKGLGRRTFRLEDEWTADTVSREFPGATQYRSTAKVHVVRSSRSVQDIRDPNRAQQNSSASQRDDLFDFFLESLKEAGGPFGSNTRPIVAGMILDSHYDKSRDLILGHASSHSHNPDGISLGMFGSHLTYSWPRFIEEVTASLIDIRPPGDTVGNDGGSCNTMWEACALGQGAYMLEVGHAFGLPVRPGIKESGYYQDWPKHFLSKTAGLGDYGTVDGVVNDKTPNAARWDLADALALRMLPHFHLQTDPHICREQRDAKPTVQICFDQFGEAAFNKTLHISSYDDGIARISFNDRHMREPTCTELVENRYKFCALSASRLEHRYDRARPLRLRVLGTNGKETIVDDVWKLLAEKTALYIAGGVICLTKRSVIREDLAGGTHDCYEWAQLLREKGEDGTVHRATSISLRIGCHWDGGVVKYSDGHTSHWGPMCHEGNRHHIGGAPKDIEIPDGVEITCIEVNKGRHSVMDGVRMHLSNGTVAGELNDHYEYHSEIVKLKPTTHEVIVGFFGKSEKRDFCGVVEFGIITAPKRIGLEGLPESVYDLPEWKNMAGMDDVNNY